MLLQILLVYAIKSRDVILPTKIHRYALFCRFLYLTQHGASNQPFTKLKISLQQRHISVIFAFY